MDTDETQERAGQLPHEPEIRPTAPTPATSAPLGTPANAPEQPAVQAENTMRGSLKKDLADLNIAARVKDINAQGKQSLQSIADDLVKQGTAQAQASSTKPDIRSGKFAIPPLRTFQGDAAEAIEKKNASLLSIKMAEEDRRKSEGEQKIEAKVVRFSVSTVSIALSLLLILTGITAVFMIQYFSQRGAEGPGPGVAYDTLMPYDSREEFSIIDRDQAIEAFSAKRNGNILPNEHIQHLKVTTSPSPGGGTDFQGFLNAIGASAPAPLMRALDGKYMVGVYSGGDKNQLFILMKVASFENAWSGMLAWETSMAESIAPLFTSESIARPEQSGTSTPASPAGAFGDLLVQNVDARVLRGESGRTILLYSFADKETIVITTDETSFRGLLGKLRAAKLVR